MKKRVAAVFAGILASSVILSGCQASKGLETDELKITQYKDVEVEQVEKPEEVTDEEVDNYITTVLQSKPDTEDTERTVKEGDVVNIDYVGKVDGEEFAGGSYSGYMLEIGSDSFIDGFEDSVIGHKIGDTYDWNGKFPDEYSNSPDLAGKDVVFTITVNGFQPELTDDFVKTVSEESKSVKEYKEEVKKQLTEESEENYRTQLGNLAWQAVLDNTEVLKYPEDELEQLKNEIIDQIKTEAEAQNVEYEEYLEQNGTTAEDFEKQIEDDRKEYLKQIMVLNAIADKEKLNLSDEEYEKKLEEIAENVGYEDVDTLKEMVEEDDLKNVALSYVVVDWLADNCIQKAE